MATAIAGPLVLVADDDEDLLDRLRILLEERT